MSAALAKSPRLDLRWYLTLRVTAVALICFVATLTLALIGTRRQVEANNASVASAVARQLEIQLFRVASNMDVMSRFPDWEPVTSVALSPGQCVRYLGPDRSIQRASCLGYYQADLPPTWFNVFLGPVLTPRSTVERPIAYHNKSYGVLVVTAEQSAMLAAMWRDLSNLLVLTTLLVLSLCVLQHVVIGRALHPTQQVLAGLDRLAQSDFSFRLPPFRLMELQRISEVFNALAARLERTTQEKAELAAKLVDNQEQERLKLARDLHDELAQNLSAMGAVAASIKETARSACPELVPEADRISGISSGIVRSLQKTLHALRPPEIDELGLADSLLMLAVDQEGSSEGRLRIKLSIKGEVSRLSPTTACHVYRIIQEGLTNVVKHSDAREAKVALTLASRTTQKGPLDDRRLTLSIEDDGTAASAAIPSGGGGLGLIGMRERIAALGGELSVERKPCGFVLHASIPISSRTLG